MKIDYKRIDINNPTEEIVSKTLDGFKEIASVRIFMNKKGDFAINHTVSKEAFIIVENADKSEIEFDSVIKNTLVNGANNFLDYLEKCYAEGIKNLENEFIEFLKKEGVI